MRLRQGGERLPHKWKNVAREHTNTINPAFADKSEGGGVPHTPTWGGSAPRPPLKWLPPPPSPPPWKQNAEMERWAFVALILPSMFSSALLFRKMFVCRFIEINPQTKSQSLHKSFFVDFQIVL